MAYTAIDAFQSFRLRGTNQQTNVGLLYTPPSITQHAVGGSPQTRTTALLEGLALGYASIHNRSGSTGAHGIGVRLPNRLWIAGQWDDSESTAFTDDTTDAQDAGASDFALDSTTADDGFVIACREKFSAISINVGTADTGAPVRAVRYSDAEGDGWTALTNLFIHDGSGAVYTTGEQVIVFAPPADWGRTQTDGLSGIPAGYYALNVRATTAPDSAASATAIEVCHLYLVTEGVVDNGTLERPDAVPLRLPFGNGLVCLFGTAASGNRVTAQCKVLT